MPCIHLFNPENDLALAHGGSNYTAPSNALALRNAGAVLPLWYGSNGDEFIALGVDEYWLEKTRRLFDININVFNGVHGDAAIEASPWGWSLDARRQFVNYGVPEELLKTADEIEILRRLSHRRITRDVMMRLRELVAFELPPLPMEAFSAEEVIDYAVSNDGCFVKSPWSSSGRGVFDATNMPKKELLTRCTGLIGRQGSVMCEASLNKVDDFAMLFYCDGIKVSHVGYSYFFTEHGAAYSGNVLAPDEIIEQSLARKVSCEQLRSVSKSLEIVLTDIIAPYYYGYFGVDMLLYKKNDIMLIDPCVEINLRMTMGVLAWKFRENYLSPDSRALMRVEYGKCSASMDKPQVNNSRLEKGTLSLIPENDRFYITIDALASKTFQFGI